MVKKRELPDQSDNHIPKKAKIDHNIPSSYYIVSSMTYSKPTSFL